MIRLDKAGVVARTIRARRGGDIMAAHTLESVRNGGDRLRIRLPPGVQVMRRFDERIFINGSTGSWICCRPDGSAILDAVSAGESLTIGQIIETTRPQVMAGAIEDDARSDLILAFISLCLDKEVLQLDDGTEPRAAEYMDVKRITMDEATWAIAGDCNLRCKHCYFSQNLDNRVVYDPEVESFIVDEICANCSSLTITGGEPLSHPRILQHLAALSRQLDAITILTNGLLMTPEFASNIAALGNVSLQISLDGASAEHHDAIRGRGTFDRTLEVLKVLSEHRIAYVLSMVPMQSNLRDLPALIELARAHGTRNLHFPLYQENGRGRENSTRLEPEISEVIDFFAAVMDLQFSGEIFNGHTYLMAESARHPPRLRKINCGAGHGVFIDYKGDVFPCSGFSNADFRCGTLREHTLKWIYDNSDVLRTAREMTPLRSEQCRFCAFQTYCTGGCRSRAYFANSDASAQDPYCPLYQYEYERILWQMVDEQKRERPHPHNAGNPAA